MANNSPVISVAVVEHTAFIKLPPRASFSSSVDFKTLVTNCLNNFLAHIGIYVTGINIHGHAYFLLAVARVFVDKCLELVCDDKLGIAAELEEAMANVIGTYECEWKKAVEDPQTLRRFRHFVNSERLDPAVRMVPERGQRRPAKPDERRVAEEALS